ncbi:MAG: hypothetical protein SXG53_18310, partial [Pseudomonadota bacterium]|nr:hypothetical protein [Pseudomonadota bacterium]
ALHYAARYASAPMIRLLVSSGAAPFSKARRDESASEESPLDWLNAYVRSTPKKKDPSHAVIAPEVNSSIAAAELPALQELLRVPDETE